MYMERDFDERGLSHRTWLLARSLKRTELNTFVNLSDGRMCCIGI